MKLSYTFSADGSGIMSTGATSGNATPGVAGILTDVRVVSSADTTVAASIADATGNVFNVASSDFTTATQYKNDNAAILRNGVTGQLTATISGLGSGTFTITAWIKPD